MTTLLFPGRHLLNTAFQERYLYQVLRMPLAGLAFVDGVGPTTVEPFDRVIFAITSANQAHSRYNPIPFHVRALGVDRLARDLRAALDVDYRINGIPHFDPTPRFAEYVLKEIEEQSEGILELTPANCAVLCSTEVVTTMYRRLGFAVLPAEAAYPLDAPGRPATPIELLRRVVASGEDWSSDPTIRAELSPATFSLWRDFPDVPRRIIRLWRDPLLNEEGSLTVERDYSSYAYGMGNRDIIELKYRDIRHAVVPGKIVDEGCADGALLVPLARDFPDSDLIGIEITGEFIARAWERHRAGDFGGTFVHFHQRNITEPIFEDSSIDTTICNSTVHELWSYGQGAATVGEYFARKYRQTNRGGRLIIRDVVGPDDGGREVYLWLNDADGANENVHRRCENAVELEQHVAALSTYGRFLRFSQDFLAEERGAGRRGLESRVRYREEDVDGRRTVVLPLKDAAEFLSKKDYADNWQSEMHEEFAFWSFAEWKAALQAAGFHVIENPNDPGKSSRVYSNPWIVANRYEGRVALFTREGNTLHPLDWPPTNIVLIGERR
jgi:hypothetical protein